MNPVRSPLNASAAMANTLCTINGDPPSVGSGINVTEARAIQAENEYRLRMVGGTLRTMHDTLGSEREPLEALDESTIPVCDDPTAFPDFSPFHFPR